MGNEVKYISTDDKSNKIWSYEIDGTSVTIRFGRIGGHITTQEKDFPNETKMWNFINKKVAEKTADKPGKRYKQVTDEKVQEETETAQDIGHQNKIVRTLFVRKDKKRLHELKAYDPDHFVMVEMMNSWSKERMIFLLSKKQSYELHGLTSKLTFGNAYEVGEFGVVAGIKKYLNRLVGKIKKVMNITIAALTERSLDLGDEDEAAFKVSLVNDDFVKKVGEAGVSNQVVETFASLGERELDL
jgi:predicted DNA-binding WGR domain protein